MSLFGHLTHLTCSSPILGVAVVSTVRNRAGRHRHHRHFVPSAAEPAAASGSFRLRILNGIDHRPIAANDGAGCQARLVDMRFPENVHHLLACGQKVVGDDPAVAAPPDRFCAHDRASVLTAPFPEPRQAGGEGGRQGVVSIVPKTGHPPIGIGRRLSGARLPPAAPEFGDMLVADLPGL
jgi:hypothetical protein